MYCQHCNLICALTIDHAEVLQSLNELKTAEQKLICSHRNQRARKELLNKRKAYEYRLDTLERDLQFLRIYHSHPRAIERDSALLFSKPIY